MKSNMETRKFALSKKKVAQVGANAGAGSDKTGIQVLRRSSSGGKDSHWDFLDDIEAPMWVDLAEECQFAYQDRDDEWFNISHPFHHCSAQQLISAFASASVGCTKLDLTVQELCSPKLPCSVSRSRGKDYQSRKWGQRKEKLIFDQQHPANNLKKIPLSGISVTERVSSNRTCSGKSVGFGGSQSDSSEKSSLTEIAKHDYSEVSLGLQKLRLGSTCSEMAQSNSSSIILSESSEIQHQKSLDSRVPVQTSSRFLSELKISLRKSCVTRQASRVQVSERRQSDGRKSSSSKSSVGSSLTHGFDGKDLINRDNKDMTPGSRYVPRDTMTSSNKVKIAKPSSTTNAKLKTGRSALPSFKERGIQGKVQQQSARSNVLAPHSINNLSSAAANLKCKGKAVGASARQISVGGKENLPRGKVPNAKFKITNDVMQVQKVTGRKLPEKIGKTTRDVQVQLVIERKLPEKNGKTTGDVQVLKAIGRKLPEKSGKTRLDSEKVWTTLLKLFP
ncbi:OLC1v1022978C2 [Oldenlandia corymbosa var. corymbosa]|uniref:OLC1v1022978C2 n=1 Tax=Oldenlandia corymbosa var. corymbosa TaxID=529605 RepID=A0AAV1BZ19_OLDCO|nr:OLC1v1022978C2 [Oldenlandia corymbosa var. corymbosa]